ncbi:MAG: hypothetical protein ABI298_03525 [Acidimicrobiales bacterium]
MNRSRSLGVALASVLIGGVALGLAGFTLASNTPHQSAHNCVPDQSQANTCNLKISTFPDSGEGVHGLNGGPHPDWVTYSNDNLVVPANTTINVTIDQYDSGGSLNNAFFDQVMGTIGGTATYNGKTESHVDPNNIGHTFTLRGIPGTGTDLFVSVPLPADNGTDNSVVLNGTNYNKPVVVTFSFKTGSKGVYEWNCEFPCGGSRQGQFGEAMSTYGYMTGALTVE